MVNLFERNQPSTELLAWAKENTYMKPESTDKLPDNSPDNSPDTLPPADTSTNDKLSIPDYLTDDASKKILAEHNNKANTILELLKQIFPSKSEQDNQSIVMLLKEIEGIEILHDDNKISITINGQKYDYPTMSQNDFIDELKDIIPNHDWAPYEEYINKFNAILYNGENHIMNDKTFTELDKQMLPILEKIQQQAKKEIPKAKPKENNKGFTFGNKRSTFGGKLKTRKNKVKKFKKQTHKKFKKYKGGDFGIGTGLVLCALLCAPAAAAILVVVTILGKAARGLARGLGLVH